MTVEFLNVLSVCILLTSLTNLLYSVKILCVNNNVAKNINILQKLYDKNTEEACLNSRLEQLQRMKFSPMRSRIEK